jgi:hypothetical protein
MLSQSDHERLSQRHDAEADGLTHQVAEVGAVKKYGSQARSTTETAATPTTTPDRPNAEAARGSLWMGDDPMSPRTRV